MARRPDPTIRADLTDKAIGYVLSHGVADLSLRPLAKELGTSARMLVYHFSSREGLMRAILDGLRRREDALIVAWMEGGDRTLGEFLHRYWQRMSDPRARPAIRMIFELYALALRDPGSYPGVLTAPLGHWRRYARATNFAPERREALVTLLMAATRGLLLDLCATGEKTRIDAAMALLTGFIDGSARAPRKDSPRSRPRSAR